MAKKNTKTVAVAVETVAAPVKKTTSARIRELAAEGKSRSEIVKLISAEQGKAIRYQHVRNVLVTQLKKVDTSKSV